MGNHLLFIGGTSETLRNGIVSHISWPLAQEAKAENVKAISVHSSKYLKPLSDNQFGHYLAGLIDGDGHFSSQQQLVIVFNGLDVSLAYYIKERLGFGHVRKLKDRNAYILVISNTEGLTKVINLIDGKLRTYNQVINNILSNHKYENLKKSLDFKINSTKDFNNHWIAGFSDADASFQIKVINKPSRSKPEIRLNYQIDQSDSNVLILIKEYFGGNIGYRKSQNTYYYGSTSFGSAKNVIKYFDEYHLQSTKHINYLKWRKAYILIQNKDHLTEKGINQIIELKDSMRYDLR